MKKWGILALVVGTAVISASIASAASQITLIVNGKIASTEPKIIDGVTYVPLRATAELLGSDVNFDATTNTITVTSKDAAPVVTSNAKSFDVDITFESGPLVMNISKVTLDPAFKEYEYLDPVSAVVFDATIENTSSDIVGWFPSWEIVTNTKKQVYGHELGDVDGSFKGKVVKEGKVVFETENVTDITSLNLFIERAHKEVGNGYEYFGEDQSTEIILK